jgi:Sec-independent protein translocase protein TatA
MKIKRSILKQIIKEEIGADPELINAIELLTKKIDNLDVSIDYLAAAATGEDALALSFGQSRFGRAARSKKKTNYDFKQGSQAVDEEFSVTERELTDAEEDEKEDVVKGMKKNKKDFKKRYGKEADDVMYGAATNIAKKNRGK